MDLDEAARLRKEKMNQIKKKMENDDQFYRDGLTSAPSLVQVDEFHEELSMAERRKREEAERLRLNGAPNKQRFFMDLNKKNPDRREDDIATNLDHNALVDESSKRSQHHNASKKIDQEIQSLFGDDPDLLNMSVSTISGQMSDKLHDNIESPIRRIEPKRSNIGEKVQPNSWSPSESKNSILMVAENLEGNGRASLLDQNRNNLIKGNERPESFKTKIYNDGRYVDASFDSGNGSSLPPFNNNPATNTNKVISKQSTQDDPLSQSLQDWKLRKMALAEEDSKVTCVYDKRMFANDKTGAPSRRKAFDSETEEEYFNKMQAQNNRKRNSMTEGSKVSSENRNSFRNFLSNSFSKSQTQPNVENKKPSNVIHESTVVVSGVHKEEPWRRNNNMTASVPIPDNDELVDCIDLKNDERERKFRRTHSPDNMSVRTSVTEFGEPDTRGRARKIHKRINHRPQNFSQRSRDFLSSSFGGLLVLIQGRSSSGPNSVMAMTNGVDRMAAQNSASKFDEDDFEEESCSRCGRGSKPNRRRRGLSCATLLFLLAIDAFTIALLLILFYNINQISGPPPYPYPREGRESQLDNPYFDKRTANGRNFVDEHQDPNVGVSINVAGPPVVMNLPSDGRGREFGARGLSPGNDSREETTLKDVAEKPDEITAEFIGLSNSTRRDQRNIILRRTVQVEEPFKDPRSNVNHFIDLFSHSPPTSSETLTSTKESANENNSSSTSLESRSTSTTSTTEATTSGQEVNLLIGAEESELPSKTSSASTTTTSSSSTSSSTSTSTSTTTTVTSTSSTSSSTSSTTSSSSSTTSSTSSTTSSTSSTTSSTSSTTSSTSSTTSSTSSTTSSTSSFEFPSKTVQQLSSELERVKHYIDHDMTQLIINMSDEITKLKREIETMSHPPAFACHRTDPFTHEGIITFNTCNIFTEGMDPSSGIFTVKVAGIYQLSFTGLFHVMNGHQIDADIIRQTPDGRFSNLGRSSADTNEIATFFVPGTDDDLMITATMMTMARLEVEDKIYVETHLSEGHGKSTLKSTSADPGIHFVGQRIGT